MLSCSQFNMRSYAAIWLFRESLRKHKKEVSIKASSLPHGLTVPSAH